MVLVTLIGIRLVQLICRFGVPGRDLGVHRWYFGIHGMHFVVPGRDFGETGRRLGGGARGRYMGDMKETLVYLEGI